jgi:hypothetical protein
MTDCILWRGAKINEYGYRYFRGKDTRAHRAAYIETYGDIPTGLVIDHLCGVTLCVNPEHLEAVTQGVNIARSSSISTINRLKTHCARGHKFSNKNTHVDNAGKRVCRPCERERLRVYNLKRKQTPLSGFARG